MRNAALFEIFAVFVRRVERARQQRMLETDDGSLHGEIAAANQMTAMKQAQFAGIAAEVQGLAGVSGSHSDTKSPGVRRRHHARDLLSQSGIDEFALAQNENPIG